MEYRKKIVIGLGILTLGISGCDKFYSYFNKKEEIKEEDQQIPEVSSETPQKVPPVAAPQEIPPPNLLAKVGNWQVTLDEFNDRLKALKEVLPEFNINDSKNRKIVLEELVNQELIVQGAQNSGIAQEKDIKAAIEEFRRTLIVKEVARRLTKDVKVTEEEAKQFYEERKKEFVEPPKVRLREIVVDTKEKGKELLTQILNGSEFAEIAKQNSKAKTKDKGGDLGFLMEAPFPAMLTELSSLEVGDISNVFKGPEGYYIIKLEEKKGGEQIPFEKIKNEVIQIKTLEKQQKILLNHIDQLKQNIPVKVQENLIDSSSQGSNPSTPIEPPKQTPADSAKEVNKPL